MDTLEEFELFDRADVREWQRRYVAMIDSATLLHRELEEERERGRKRYHHGLTDAAMIAVALWAFVECVRVVL